MQISFKSLVEEKLRKKTSSIASNPSCTQPMHHKSFKASLAFQSSAARTKKSRIEPKNSNFNNSRITVGKDMVQEGSPPFGDLEEVLVKSDEVLGMEIESWVVEKEVRLDLSSSRSDQEFLLGHSSKKGRRN